VAWTENDAVVLVVQQRLAALAQPGTPRGTGVETGRVDPTAAALLVCTDSTTPAAAGVTRRGTWEVRSQLGAGGPRSGSEER
jgi:hypothetical protein